MSYIRHANLSFFLVVRQTKNKVFSHSPFLRAFPYFLLVVSSISLSGLVCQQMHVLYAPMEIFVV